MFMEVLIMVHMLPVRTVFNKMFGRGEEDDEMTIKNSEAESTDTETAHQLSKSDSSEQMSLSEDRTSLSDFPNDEEEETVHDLVEQHEDVHTDVTLSLREPTIEVSTSCTLQMKQDESCEPLFVSNTFNEDAESDEQEEVSYETCDTQDDSEMSQSMCSETVGRPEELEVHQDDTTAATNESMCCEMVNSPDSGIGRTDSEPTDDELSDMCGPLRTFSSLSTSSSGVFSLDGFLARTELKKLTLRRDFSKSDAALDLSGTPKRYTKRVRTAKVPQGLRLFARSKQSAEDHITRIRSSRKFDTEDVDYVAHDIACSALVKKIDEMAALREEDRGLPKTPVPSRCTSLEELPTLKELTASEPRKLRKSGIPRPMKRAESLQFVNNY